MQHRSEHGGILFLFGTRPEAIKLCPVFLEMQRAGLSYSAVNTGQHRDMVLGVLRYFGCRADEDLDIMQPAQTPLSLTQTLLARLPRVYQTHRPRMVAVHGDTATAFAGALCAYLSGIPVAHIEAGLRTGDIRAPFPEEYHRVAIDAASDLFFAPTETAVCTLLREGRPKDRIFLTGNTATDAVRLCLSGDEGWSTAALLAACTPIDGKPLPAGEMLSGQQLLLLTTHRRELDDRHLLTLLCALRRAINGRENVCLLFPVHPSPRIRAAATAAFAGCDNAHLIEPLALPHMQRLLARATLLMTDSGGLQEEAVYLGIPTMVLREVTERPEGVAAGVLLPVGCEGEPVERAACRLLDDDALRARMAHPAAVYGDGHAAKKIVTHLQKYVQ